LHVCSWVRRKYFLKLHDIVVAQLADDCFPRNHPVPAVLFLLSDTPLLLGGWASWSNFGGMQYDVGYFIRSICKAKESFKAYTLEIRDYTSQSYTSIGCIISSRCSGLFTKSIYGARMPVPIPCRFAVLSFEGFIWLVAAYYSSHVAHPSWIYSYWTAVVMDSGTYVWVPVQPHADGKFRKTHMRTVAHVVGAYLPSSSALVPTTSFKPGELHFVDEPPKTVSKYSVGVEIVDMSTLRRLMMEYGTIIRWTLHPSSLTRLRSMLMLDDEQKSEENVPALGGYLRKMQKKHELVKFISDKHDYFLLFLQLAKCDKY